MTTNQLKWAELKEGIRHNIVSEALESRKAGASETQAQAALGQVGVGYANVGLGYKTLDLNRDRFDFEQYQYQDTGREKISSETARNLSDAALKQAQGEVATEQKKLLGAQVVNVGADTQLKKAQRTKAYNDIAVGYVNALSNLVGSAADVADIITKVGGTGAIAGQMMLGF